MSDQVLITEQPNPVTVTDSGATVIGINSQGPAGPQGVAGPAGATGPTGANGQGVPTGGTTNQLLAKIDSTNYNTQWITNTSITKALAIAMAAAL